MLFQGERRGDSGYALEELLLGGRLKHRYLVGRSRVQVWRLSPLSRNVDVVSHLILYFVLVADATTCPSSGRISQNTRKGEVVDGHIRFETA